MNTYQIILLVILGAALIGYIIMRATKKDFLPYLKTVYPVISALYKILEISYGVFPNATLQKIITIVKTGMEGVTKAEELWKIGDLEKEAREKYAKMYIIEMLNTANITVNETVETIINAVIKLTCAILPHSDESKEI